MLCSGVCPAPVTLPGEVMELCLDSQPALSSPPRDVAASPAAPASSGQKRGCVAAPGSAAGDAAEAAELRCGPALFLPVPCSGPSPSGRPHPARSDLWRRRRNLEANSRHYQTPVLWERATSLKLCKSHCLVTCLLYVYSEHI